MKRLSGVVAMGMGLRLDWLKVGQCLKRRRKTLFFKNQDTTNLRGHGDAS
jgi:hypothetical protein